MARRTDESFQAGAKARQHAAPALRRASRRPVLRFVLLFAGCMVFYYVVSSASLVRDRIFPALLELNATVSARLLGLLGQGPIRADGASVHSDRFSIEVARGCDAIEPMALLVSAILASPMTFRARFVGMVAGVLGLMAMNLLRIVTLFLFGVYWPAAFHVMHVDVWQVIFILLAVATWLVWAWWALKAEPVAPSRSLHD
ncbi:Transmembrane exosortase (Exosortase_EpsH) [Phycisphaerae bacterium RAS2]|nr:Transmembrane exosortase (Exosortase_EpsH) [Phycisphaerae bacterium RAS2]